MSSPFRLRTWGRRTWRKEWQRWVQTPEGAARGLAHKPHSKEDIVNGVIFKSCFKRSYWWLLFYQISKNLLNISAELEREKIIRPVEAGSLLFGFDSGAVVLFESGSPCCSLCEVVTVCVCPDLPKGTWDFIAVLRGWRLWENPLCC